MMIKSNLLFKTLVIILHIDSIVSLATQPSGLYDNETTTCEEFSRFARFNPYSVIGDEWMSFYYWGPPQSPMFINLTVPGTPEREFLKYIFHGHTKEQIDWMTATVLVMIHRTNRTTVLVERNDRGHYYLYNPYKGLPKGEILPALDVRIKQTGDGKYFAIMDCEEDTVFIFSRLSDVPKKVNLQDEAARIGYRGRGGKSYLYQGHNWMPIGEADDEDFEEAMKRRY